MRYLVRVGVFTMIGGVLAASCVPDFRFADEPQAAPDAGGGAGAGGGGGGGGGGGENVLRCGSPSTACLPGEVCCAHLTLFDCDHCSASTACGIPGCATADFAVLACNDASDCLAGEVCCVAIDRAASGDRIPSSSQCATACATKDRTACRNDADCASLDPARRCTPLAYIGYLICE